MDEQAPIPASKRRWLRFSLKWLFVFVTIFACWLGWIIQQLARRAELARSIESRGGWLSDVNMTAPCEGRPLPLTWQMLGACHPQTIWLPAS